MREVNVPRLGRIGGCALTLTVLALASVFIGGDFLRGLREWRPGLDWGGDMKQHWTAARMVEEAGFPWLYRDFHFSREITRDFHEDNFDHGRFLDRHDYRYGPIVAWVAWQLRGLPYAAWLALWLALSLACLASGWWWLRRTWPSLTTGPGGWLALAAFPPTLYAFSIYQNAPLTFGILSPALLLAAHGCAAGSGALLACLHYKPQLLVFLFAGLLMAREWKAALALAAVSLVFLLCGLLAAGWEAHLAWVESLVAIMRGLQGDEMATNVPWRGFLATTLPTLSPTSVSLLAHGLLLASGAALFLWLQRDRDRGTPPSLPEVVAAALGWWLVFSPHVKPYDLLLAFPATIVLLARSGGRHAVWIWSALWTAGCLAVFARLIGPSLAAVPLTVWWGLLLVPAPVRR